MNLPLIEAALRDGARIHAFRSGGGLRVVRVNDAAGTFIAYGEHPHIEDALEHAEWSLANGTTDYKTMYSGENAQFTQYYTGSTEPSSPVDQWVLSGHTFDVFYVDGAFMAVCLDTVMIETPQFVWDATLKQGVTTYWEDSRGVQFTVRPTRFPDGSMGATMDHTLVPEGVDTLFTKSISESIGSTVLDALTLMVQSPRTTITYTQRTAEAGAPA